MTDKYVMVCQYVPEKGHFVAMVEGPDGARVVDLPMGYNPEEDHGRYAIEIVMADKEDFDSSNLSLVAEGTGNSEYLAPKNMKWPKL